jgi:REP element-mobilizing transposase RayT
MSAQKQLPFIATSKRHGGGTRVGKRKIARPIVTKRPMHVVLRSSRARGKLSLHTHARAIQAIVAALGKKFEVKVFQSSNNGNHLHLLVQATERNAFKSFLMALSGRIAQEVTGAKKGKGQGFSFWDHTPFTRIVEWGRDFFNTHSYVIQNVFESVRVIPYQARGTSPQPSTTMPS